MRPEDRVRVLHMVEASESVITFVTGRQRSDLDSDRMLLFAVVRGIEIVGEAAGRLLSFRVRLERRASARPPRHIHPWRRGSDALQ